MNCEIWDMAATKRVVIVKAKAIICLLRDQQSGPGITLRPLSDLLAFDDFTKEKKK
jgi:hypothetical protein